MPFHTKSSLESDLKTLSGLFTHKGQGVRADVSLYCTGLVCQHQLWTLTGLQRYCTFYSWPNSAVTSQLSGRHLYEGSVPWWLLGDYC